MGLSGVISAQAIVECLGLLGMVSGMGNGGMYGAVSCDRWDRQWWHIWGCEV